MRGKTIKYKIDANGAVAMLLETKSSRYQDKGVKMTLYGQCSNVDITVPFGQEMAPLVPCVLRDNKFIKVSEMTKDDVRKYIQEHGEKYYFLFKEIFSVYRASIRYDKKNNPVSVGVLCAVPTEWRIETLSKKSGDITCKWGTIQDSLMESVQHRVLDYCKPFIKF